ncbi:hypothetical protein BDC45DRAFT_524881, partial [Circinella umbellata]
MVGGFLMGFFLSIFIFQESNIQKATIIKVIPFRHQGTGTLCEIHHGEASIPSFFIY